MAKLPKITMLKAEKLVHRDHPGLWERMTPQERREAVGKLNAEREGRNASTDAEAFIRRQFRKPRR